MPNLSPPPSSSSIPTLSPSNKRLLSSPKPKIASSPISTSKYLPQKDKITRDLPNLSDCHGCGLRINHSNPKERLQPLDSVWRIVLLCKKCTKQVNSAKKCTYCFKDTANSDSDCFKCRDCECHIHRNCILKYGNSNPWSYSFKGLAIGLGFSVCIDCWVPELLKNSIGVRKRRKSSEKGEGELSSNKGDSKGLEKGKCLAEVASNANCRMQKEIVVALKAKEKVLSKAVVAENAKELASKALDSVAKDCNGKVRKKNEGSVGSSNKGRDISNMSRVADGDRSLAEVAKEANSAVEKKIALVQKTREKALRKAVMAKTAVDLANSAVDLIAKKDFDGKNNEPLVRSSTTGSGTSDVAKIVDDAELAFQLHRAMNSSPRISKNVGVMNISCSDTDPISDTAITCGLKPELITYKRNNGKRKKCQENGEASNVSTSVGVVGKSTTGDDTKIVSESQSCQQNELKMDLHLNGAGNFSPERCNTTLVTQDWSSNSEPDRCLLKYSKRWTKPNILVEDRSGSSRYDHYLLKYNKGMTDSDVTVQNKSAQSKPECCLLKYSKRRTSSMGGAHEEANYIHEETNSYGVSCQKDKRLPSPGLPMYCLTECRAVSDISFHSCVVNLEACAPVGSSSQEEG